MRAKMCLTCGRSDHFKWSLILQSVGVFGAAESTSHCITVPLELYPPASVLPEQLYADLHASHCTVTAAYKYIVSCVK